MSDQEQSLESIPVCRPLLPVAAKLYPYLERIDAQRYYSNMGRLTIEFEERLAHHFGVEADCVVTSANGTLALIQLLKALGAQAGRLCVMPSWTFTATPTAALAAGLTPYFIDVDEKDWSIHPEKIYELIKTKNVGAVMPVAPFGCPIPLEAWERFHVATGIPVVIDAAAGFDSFRHEQFPLKSTIPFMVSLHATKVLGVGEGAVVVTGDPELAKHVRMYGNYGFQGSRISTLPGINAKLSEYVSAVGLAALDEWPLRRKEWHQLSCQFEAHLKNYPQISMAPSFNQGWVSCYGLIKLMAGHHADLIRVDLAKEGIHTLAWWGKGCHTNPAYEHCPRENLIITDDLGDRVLGLPFWIGLEESHLVRILGALNKCLTERREY